MLEEARAALRLQFEGLDAIKATIRSILNTASLILSIFGALKLGGGQLGQSIDSSRLTCGLILFALLLLISIYGLGPATLGTPLKMEAQNLAKYYNKTQKQTLEALVRRYTTEIQANEKVIQTRKVASIAVGILLAVIVIVLVI